MNQMAIPGEFAVGFLCFITRKWRESHQKKLEEYYEKKNNTESKKVYELSINSSVTRGYACYTF
ncbi:hypothetical protein PICMEDRAFT_59724 [Pichia membranifaciens NRRL Y-2026]|uniref:Uncharacterized protein n=1 Tax=Pichia membranifaciens NRRL Y-2026 TaxID=763406 RepID=A0A1E3NFH7_9ASCO|nr:hypothetical protein PICMEDRAFT_59724 [Pichia membranifaciens NRRL Y-2026]ODQ44846.1 hypothetical protein PICMEDRAFT_59724 [Pichia membranifaciens NRRL Y-2026]